MAAQYKASPLSRNTIRGMADYIRGITGTTQTAYFPILTFLEIFLPQIIADFCYEIVPVSEMPDKYGETFPMQNLIRIREDIYYNAVAGDGFARFTICHECGHLLLIDWDTISLCRAQNNEGLKTYEDPEWQANCFAGELLVYYPLAKDMSVEEIKENFGVTGAAAAVQKSKM